MRDSRLPDDIQTSRCVIKELLNANLNFIGQANSKGFRLQKLLFTTRNCIMNFTTYISLRVATS